jgi:hypothetical protein
VKKVQQRPASHCSSRALATQRQRSRKSTPVAVAGEETQEAKARTSGEAIGERTETKENGREEINVLMKEASTQGKPQTKHRSVSKTDQTRTYMQSCKATYLCNLSMQPVHATNPCNGTMQPIHATNPCTFLCNVFMQSTNNACSKQEMHVQSKSMYPTTAPPPHPLIYSRQTNPPCNNPILHPRLSYSLNTPKLCYPMPPPAALRAAQSHTAKGIQPSSPPRSPNPKPPYLKEGV